MSCLKKMGKFKPARKTIVYVFYKSDLIFQIGHSQRLSSEAICQENVKQQINLKQRWGKLWIS